MRKYILLSCIAASLGIGLYGWHLYMKANWETDINARPFHFSIKKKNNQGDASSFIPVSTNDLPQDYRKNIEIVKNGDEYIWVSNGNKKLIKSVERKPFFVQGMASDIYRENYIFTDSNGTEKITLNTSQYDTDGCKPNEHNWTGNMQVFQTLDNGDILQFYADAEVYENPFQFIFCRYLK